MRSSLLLRQETVSTKYGYMITENYLGVNPPRINFIYALARTVTFVYILRVCAPRRTGTFACLCRITVPAHTVTLSFLFYFIFPNCLELEPEKNNPAGDGI